MNVLLINPPKMNEITGSLPAALETGTGCNPPLGLLFLAGYLLRHTSFLVEIIDSQVDRLDYPDLEKRLQNTSFDVVGITAMTFTLLDVIKTAAVVKKVNPTCRVVVGGPHAHLYPKETAGLEGIDFVVPGEGEVAFAALIENINDFTALEKIKGLVYKTPEGRIIDNGVSPPIDNLDSLPFPARRLTPYKKYSSLLAKRTPVTTLITSRGCPYTCSFCDRPHFGGKGFRAMSAERVVEEIEDCLEMGIHEFLVYDDTFTVKKERVKKICRLIIRKQLDIGWEIRTRVDTVDEEMLSLLKQAGCRGIHYGIEAGTEKILKVLQKGINLEQAKQVFDLTRKNKIHILAYFMIGNPSETREDIYQTFRTARWLKPDYFHLSILSPFPGTAIYSDGLKRGILTSDRWRQFAENPGKNVEMLYWEENLRRDELVALLVKGYKSFYNRPSYILRQLLRVRSLSELARKANAGIKILFMNKKEHSAK